MAGSRRWRREVKEVNESEEVNERGLLVVRARGAAVRRPYETLREGIADGLGKARHDHD